MATNIKDILDYLLDEADAAEEEDVGDNSHHHHHQHHHHYHHIKDQLDDLEPSSHVRLLQQLLCVRHPEPALPADILDGIDSILQQQKSRRVLTQAGSIKPTAILKRDNSADVRLSLWQGDITTLAGLTAITNAANGQGLGCFQPPHRCIDNIIHSFAGPRLRHECNEVMRSRDREIDPGEAIVTGGYCLAAEYVVHTVGPQLRRGAGPTVQQREQLARCYASVLSAVEGLPATTPDGRKLVALCGISTGLFAFPAREAAAIAVRAVAEWLEEHEGTSVTDVVFDTFTDEDTAIYEEVLARVLRERTGWSSPTSSSEPRPQPVIQCDSLDRAREWLQSADAVLVSAGAGLSASDGLDYTSPTLFANHFPGFLRYGLRTLYGVFGFTGWPTEQVRWGYFFTHLAMVRAWPASDMYRTLISWLGRFEGDAHVRTSNADGLFLANGLDPDRLSTPQGAYAVLQCLANCRPDATVPSAPLVEAAQSALDPVSQVLTDPDKVPVCQFCGGKMSICVRAGDWFNEVPFQDGERRWKKFRRGTVVGGEKTTVILELGAGMSTPGVLRWPNEDLVARGRGRARLIRVGLGPETAVPWDLDEAGLAISIDGDISAVVRELLSKQIEPAMA
ncbi:appr-1-p processing enzyme family protein [Diaporthe eres]|nr:appr-1-p processing enzyme family protein [Diaporthe eres]